MFFCPCEVVTGSALRPPLPPGSLWGSVVPTPLPHLNLDAQLPWGLGVAGLPGHGGRRIQGGSQATVPLSPPSLGKGVHTATCSLTQPPWSSVSLLYCRENGPTPGPSRWLCRSVLGVEEGTRVSAAKDRPASDTLSPGPGGDPSWGRALPGLVPLLDPPSHAWATGELLSLGT